MKVGELYADESRRASREVSLGHDWVSGAEPGATFSVYWIEATREVFALRTGPTAFGPGTVKPYGLYLPVTRPAYPEDQEVTMLGTCADVDALTAIAEDGDRTLDQLRAQLAGRAS